MSNRASAFCLRPDMNFYSQALQIGIHYLSVRRDYRMNRFLAAMTLVILAVIQLIYITDPSNLIFQVVSAGRNVTIAHAAVAVLMILVLIRDYFVNSWARLGSIVLGSALLVWAVMSWFMPGFYAIIKPFDYLFYIELGVVLNLAGWTYHDEPMFNGFRRKLHDRLSIPPARKPERLA
jgi:hypothetical protein